jgi:hypothetical protein
MATKFRFWYSTLSNPLGRGLVMLFRNPINLLYLGLFVFVIFVNVEKSHSEIPTQAGYFSGTVEFNNQPAYILNTTNITAKFTKIGNQTSLEITATNSNDSETIYTKIMDFKGIGTYFIPGDGTSDNIGNVIKDVHDYQNKNNFYEATRPNAAGISNGVGRVNITAYSDDAISGNLVLIGNNPSGQQAILGAAKFQVKLHP